MNRADIQTMTEFLALVDTNPDTLAQFIEDVFDQLGMSGADKLVRADIVALTADIQTYNFPDDALKIFAAFFNGQQIHLATNSDLEAYSKSWRSSTGDPKILNQDEESARQYTLFPIPDTTSDPLIPIHGEPFGEDFPDNSLTLIYNDNRQSNIPDIFLLPVAFSTLSREFAYPSDHTDTNFSEACLAISQALFSLIGVQNA